MLLRERCQIFNRVWWAIYGRNVQEETGMKGDVDTAKAPQSKEDKEDMSSRSANGIGLAK